MGWGIGLGAHAMTVFVFHGRLGKGWEERKIAELMEKDRRPSRD
ncbi:MAG TPA: 2TM domain-containing protein [Thermomicrobiales bacterium]|nr:2TM domain-containing protein [Thermomicrobiales bacterium]